MTATATTAAIALPEEDEDTAAPRYEFDADFQQKIVALLLRDTPFAQITDGLIKPEFFENTAHAALVKVLGDHFTRYKKAPGDKTTVTHVMREAIRTKALPSEIAKLALSVLPDLFKTDVSDRDFVADQCAEFARHQAVSKAVLDSVDLIEKRQFDEVGKLMRRALDTGVVLNTGAYDYAEMSKLRTQDRKDRASGIRPPTGITTGYPIIDDYLYHKGWGRKELSVLMGAAKAGKSMGLISFSVNAIAHGYRTLYVTLEVAASIIAERIDANVAEIAMMELGTKPHEVQEKVDAFMAKAAPLIIHEFPTGTMRPSDLRRLIEHYKAQGINFDMIVVDYADLMAPERVSDNIQENSKSVYVNLRGMAMQEGLAMLTATQTNREGAKKAVAGMTDVAEDFNKIRIADIVISINVTEEERKLKHARLFFAACRNQRSGFTIRVEQDTERAKFIKQVLGEE